jgi:hypothetical protein
MRGIANPDHFQLVELMYNYIQLGGYMFYRDCGWEAGSKNRGGGRLSLCELHSAKRASFSGQGGVSRKSVCPRNVGCGTSRAAHPIAASHCPAPRSGQQLNTLSKPVPAASE